MATYKQIQDYVKGTHNRTVKTCWIAHCKELKKLPVKRAPNRESDKRQVPCESEEMKQAIFNAFRHFGMI